MLVALACLLALQTVPGKPIDQAQGKPGDSAPAKPPQEPAPGKAMNPAQGPPEERRLITVREFVI